MATLILKFRSESDFYNATVFFQFESDFTVENVNREFRALLFAVADQEDANNTEFAIDKELIESCFGFDVEGYEFEYQEKY